MNVGKCWEHGWIDTQTNEIRKTVKFKLKVPYQKIIEKLENKEQQEMIENLK